MLTIIIPTKNRSDFLIRLLNYLADTRYRYFINIGDSSNVFHAGRIRETIKKLGNRLHVVYYECPDLTGPKCLVKLVQMVSTPYVSYIGDDDFLVPNSLEKCVKFLEMNPEHVACHGVGAIISLNQDNSHVQFKNVYDYRLRSREEGVASERLINHLSNNSNVLFSVYRSEVFKKMFDNNNVIIDVSFGFDLLPACLAVIMGKIKEISCFHIIHHTHSAQIKYSKDIYDWLTSPNWFPSYQIFNKILSDELLKKDAASLDEAQLIVKRAFWSYLNYKLNSHFRNCYGTSGNTFSIRQKIKRIPGLKKMWNKTKHIKDKICPVNNITLSALLNPSSPYHVDFMPIYRAITNPQQES